MTSGKISLVSNNSNALEKAGLQFCVEKLAIGTTVRTKITVENSLFKLYYLINEHNRRLLKAERTFSGFDIYECEKGTLVAQMKANIFGTHYSLNFFSTLEIKYETSILERGKPRAFKIKVNELELMNKKPLFNVETNSFSLNFSGRVTQPSVKNFQIVHPLDPTYITLTFGKEANDSFILDFTYPWSMLNAFCVGLSSLDHKFGSD